MHYPVKVYCSRRARPLIPDLQDFATRMFEAAMRQGIRKYLPLRNNDKALARRCRLRAWEEWHHGDGWDKTVERLDAYEKRGQPT
jgi:hypothetical protein